MVKEYYLSILSGRQRGITAALIKPVLSAFTYPYSVVVNIRNILYIKNFIKGKRLSVKVISIGNITTGGTGKTPLVEYTARYLLEDDKKVAVLTRGYGDNNAPPPVKGRLGKHDNHGHVNDESLILRENLNGVPVLIGKNRVKNAETAIREYDVDCLILDDGFQHLRIKRDLDIVVIDSLNPFGGERLLPRGSLREPLKCLRRADLFIISHCDQGDSQTIKSLYTRLKLINTDAPVCESIHRPVLIEKIADGLTLEPEWLKGKKIYGLSAIGNPDSFTFTLKGLGADLIRHRVFHDHHVYTREEIDRAIYEAESLGADAIVVTQKDVVKIRNMNVKYADILTLKVEIQITRGIELYEKAITKMLNS